MFRLLTLLLVGLLPTTGMACDVSPKQLDDYWQSKTLYEKRDFLDDLSCRASANYYPNLVEPLVLMIMLDAIDHQVDGDSIHRTFQQFSCLYGMRNKPEYERVKAFMGRDLYNTLCEAELLNNYQVVKAKSGAVLRSGPGTEHQRIGLIKNGSRVMTYKLVGKWNKNWAYIDSYLGDGFIYKPLLEKY